MHGVSPLSNIKKTSYVNVFTVFFFFFFHSCELTNLAKIKKNNQSVHKKRRKSSNATKDYMKQQNVISIPV